MQANNTSDSQIYYSLTARLGARVSIRVNSYNIRCGISHFIVINCRSDMARAAEEYLSSYKLLARRSISHERKFN